jgi:hypothetical protein
VKRYDEDGNHVSTDQVDAGYYWLVKVGDDVYEVNADVALPCVPLPEELGEIVGTLEKISLPDRKSVYGPADVREGHIAAWGQVI